MLKCNFNGTVKVQIFFKIDKKKRRIICIYAIFVVPLQRILKYSNKIY